MFGQQTATPFGSPAATNPTPFGTQTNTAPAFGGGSAFGAPAPAAATGGFGGFGTQAPAPSGFGGFGSAPQAQTGFGATPSAFGTPAPAPAPTGFGAQTASTPFGSPAPAAGGLFGGGAPAPAPGGLFGGGATTQGGFGGTPAPAPGGFGGFGGTTTTATTTRGFGAPSTGPFGAPAQPATNLFGSTAPAPSAFGSTPSTTPAFGAPTPGATGNLFGGGATTAAPSTGAFGAPNAPPAGAAGGSKIAPYGVTTKADGASTMSLHAISAMAAYENKSFEELRFEDYSMGNKGDGGGAASTGFGFGAGGAAPAATGFGAAAAPAPGALFGSTPATAPGAFGGSTFGATAPAPGGFGAAAPGAFGTTPAPAPGGFGSNFGAQAPAPAAGGFGFGAAKPPATPLFGGAPAPAPGGGLFGAPPAPAPAPGLFGSAPAPAPGGFFGTQAPAPSLFGGASAPAPSTGLFGATPGPAPGGFGAATSPAPAPGTSFFGSGAAPAPTSAFGAPVGGNLFGAQAPGPAGGMFGAAKPPGGGLFGQPAPAGGGFFSGPAPAPTTFGLFGAAPATAAAPYAISTGAVPASVVPPTADAILLQQLAAVENQRKDLEKLEVWRGRSPAGSSVIPQSLSETESRLSSYSATSIGLTSYRASPKSSAQIRPRGFGSATTPSTVPSLGTLGKAGSPIMSPDIYVGSSVKRLVIKPDALTPKPSRRLLLTDGAADAAETAGRIRSDVASPLVNGNFTSPDASVVGTKRAPTIASLPASKDRDIDLSTPVPQNGNAHGSGAPDGSPTISGRKGETPAKNGYAYDFYQQVVSPSEKPATATKTVNGDFTPKLTKSGYTMIPSPEEMSAMSEADLAAVTGFTVFREGYGSVSWDGAVDVRGVDLDSVISIEERDIAVYDAEDAIGTKPPVGSKLNRPAVLTIYKVFPKQGPSAGTEVMEKFKRKITKQTAKMGAELLNFDSENGEWKFRVHHFSRYGLTDDSDEEDDDADMDMVTEQENIGGTQSRGAHFESGERGGRSPRGDIGEENLTEVNGEFVTDETMLEKDEDDIVALVSDAESPDSKLLQAAEDAYAMFSNLEVNDQTDVGQKGGTREGETPDTKCFADEGWTISDYGEVNTQTSPGEFSSVATRSGICSKLARRCGLKSDTASSTDFGMRLGRSFRVGWRPDGSFMSLRSVSKDGKGGVLVVRRPIFTDEYDTPISQSSLQTHLKHSSKDSTSIQSCPFYSLPKTVDASGGTPSSHISWCGAVAGYAQASNTIPTNTADPEQSEVVKRAFSLLMCLYGVEKLGVGGIQTTEEASYSRGSALSSCRVQAFANWLKEACASDVQRDIRSAEEKNETHSAILAALAGGDILRACQIATEHGYLQVSAIISSGTSGRDHLREQVQLWHESGAATHIPAGLLRIYTLLSGDLELEEKLYSVSSGSVTDKSLDWRRHLAMRLLYDSGSNAEQNLISNLVRDYDGGTASGVAPYPFPRYVTNGCYEANDREECLLYRILQLYTGVGKADHREKRTLSNIISPTGYTISRHNLSHAFHLAAVISAIGCCKPLTPFEKANLIHSYAAQLVDAGMWEWASYAFLCPIGDASLEELEWRKQQAKTLVLQHFCDSDSSASERRTFLEQNVGVPSAWFEEALSGRHAYAGDVLGYVTHLSCFSAERARMAFEELMLPNLLFMRSTEQSMKLLELFGSDDGTLAACIFDLFRLSEEVQRLSRAEPKQGKESAPQLLEHAAAVQATLLACKTDQTRSGSLTRMYTGYRIVPRASFLAEALAALSFLQFQLKALEEGIDIFDDGHARGKSHGVQLKVASQLAYISASESIVMDQGGSSSESIVKSLI